MTEDAPPQAVRTLRPQPPPSGIYASKYTREFGAEICMRVARGESLRAICQNHRFMPTEKTVWNWARSHAEFAALWSWARTTARLEAKERQKVRDLARRDAPSKTGRRAWNRGRTTCSPERMEAVLSRLRDGEALYRVCREPGMPSAATFYNWMRARPELVDAYLKAREVAFFMLSYELADGAAGMGPATSIRAFEQEARAVLGRCGKLAPRGYARGVYGIVDDPA